MAAQKWVLGWGYVRSEACREGSGEMADGANLKQVRAGG
jgi:hypothetical protein